MADEAGAPYRNHIPGDAQAHACAFNHEPRLSNRKTCAAWPRSSCVGEGADAKAFASSAFFIRALMDSILPVISAILAFPAAVLLEGQLTQSDSWLSHLASSPLALAEGPAEAPATTPFACVPLRLPMLDIGSEENFLNPLIGLKPVGLSSLPRQRRRAIPLKRHVGACRRVPLISNAPQSRRQNEMEPKRGLPWCVRLNRPDAAIQARRG